MPDSAIPSALGYSQASGIPFDYAIIKNRYIHRTFIRPSDKLRARDIPLKLNPLPEALAGKRVIVVDDSIVRGATTKKVVKTLYGAGAANVSVLISSPPVRYPDFYGIDTPRQDDLLAARLTVDEMAAEIGCDYLGFLSYSGMIDATGAPADRFSTSCFNGVYPIDILERSQEVSELSPMF
jgi:amidophosphoribosyltransferase